MNEKVFLLLELIFYTSRVCDLTWDEMKLHFIILFLWIWTAFLLKFSTFFISIFFFFHPFLRMLLLSDNIFHPTLNFCLSSNAPYRANLKCVKILIALQWFHIIISSQTTCRLQFIFFPFCSDHFRLKKAVRWSMNKRLFYGYKWDRL